MGPEFLPEITPQDILMQGAFGGTYFRPIYSAVLGMHLSGCHEEFDEFQDIPLEKMISPRYDTAVNKYKVKCGMSLEYWEGKSWIQPIDPRGWFQWYCRYYQGRRCEDDVRQIKRWYRVKKVFGQHPRMTDKIRQVLHHWAIRPPS